MDIKQHTTALAQFRSTLYQSFAHRADTLMELLDAICSRAEAKSVVEYSLADCFRRSYSTIFKAINEIKLNEMALPQQLAPYLPRPQAWPFWLLIVDVTPAPRPYAATLEDRGMVYQPEVVKGKLPVTIGHQYSSVTLGLEAEAGVSASWVLPLLTQRVATEADKEWVGADQITRLMHEETLPFGRELTVVVADSSYSKAAYLHRQRQFPYLVTLVRVPGNRVFYQLPAPRALDGTTPERGHPTWYGEPFALSDPASWSPPHQSLTWWESSRRGTRYRVEIQAWTNLLMRGKQQPDPLPMHQYPFTLLRVMRYDLAGKPLCKRPLWLIVMGQQRAALTLRHSYQAYTARFDIEHFFRFGKQKLLLIHFQTPQVEREETWWHLVHLAYAQLWMARHVADRLPRPWERNLPVIQARQISPTLVQRDFARLIRQLGTPAQPPKPRGISPGRPKGTILPKRPRHKVVVKHRRAAQAA
jgi:hypothetical protein